MFYEFKFGDVSTSQCSTFFSPRHFSTKGMYKKVLSTRFLHSCYNCLCKKQHCYARMFSDVVAELIWNHFEAQYKIF